MTKRKKIGLVLVLALLLGGVIGVWLMLKPKPATVPVSDGSDTDTPTPPGVVPPPVQPPTTITTPPPVATATPTEVHTPNGTPNGGTANWTGAARILINHGV